MSLWKWNNAEMEVDFTDAAFMEKFENAYEEMTEDSKKILKVGKQSEIIRSQCNVFFNFYDRVFGPGTSKRMFGDKVSIDLCLQSIDSLYAFRDKENQRYREMKNKYNPQFRGYLSKNKQHGKKR